ncbi:hypothetical protein SAMN04487936_101428 [Halobacillus dabanensis]|uniref:Uncharacterized protein n=1 Tax=Halobacillus dabanensis TaxID=240302 RepID=A0A1I3PSF5_HALDA|nr:hypothetical protein [Halobacillus dabanensis]SFJ24463.1 hypothetical protein SAMN04487936_101428 [Halobacillus dabanensis]
MSFFRKVETSGVDRSYGKVGVIKLVDFILVFIIGTVGVGLAVIGCILAFLNNARRPDHEERIRQLEEEIEGWKSDQDDV